MKLLKNIVAGALLAGIPAAAFAATPLVNVISEQAPLVYYVKDLPSLMEKWEKSPWMRSWEDPQVQKFFAPFRESADFKKLEEECKAETGLTVSEIVDFVQGDALVAVTNLDFEVGEEMPANMPVLFAIQVGDNAGKVEKLIVEQQAKHTEDSTYTEEDFAGTTIHTRASAEDGTEMFSWTIAEGVLAFSPSKVELQTLIDALKNGGVENSLGKAERFLAMRKDSENAQFRLVVNFATIVPWVQQLIAEKSAGQQPNPMLNPAAIIPALGLDAWRDLYLGIEFSDAATVLTGGLTYTEARGLTKMMAYREGLPSRPAFLPASSINSSIGRFSIRDMYAALEEMINAYNPGVLGMGQMYLDQFNQKLGIDFKRDFIGSFGDELSSAYLRRPGSNGSISIEGMDQFVSISLDDAKTFTGAIDAFMKSGGPSAEQLIKKREYLGYTINTITPPTAAGQPAKSVSYAIAKNYFLMGVGTPAALEPVLQGFDGKQPSFWDRKDVKQALSEVPANAISFSYTDTAELLAAFCKTAADLAEKSAAVQQYDDEGEPVENKIQVDPSATPDAETLAKYWDDSSGFGTRDANGVYFKSSLNYKK